MFCPNIIKLLVCGQAATGKSSLTSRYVHDVYSDTTNMTIGVDFLVKHDHIEVKLDEQLTHTEQGHSTLPKQLEVRLQIWDTAGQERFRSIVNQFLRNNKGVILVIDVTDYSSYQEMKEYWLPWLEEHKEESVPIVVALNKIDMLGSSPQTEDRENVQNNVTNALESCHFYLEMVEYLNSKAIPFVPCSAKTGLGVKELFHLVTREAIRCDPKLICHSSNNDNPLLNLTKQKTVIAKSSCC